MRIHIVQKGDTLWKIAQKYNVDFEQLKQLNSHLANPDYILPGMKIKIPAKKETHMQKKEYPEAVHPFKEHIQPAHPVKKEQPIKEAPKKEIPKKEAPKPAPKPYYFPKPPLTISPEIDVNQYYLFNMANLANLKFEQPAPHVPHVPPMPPVPPKVEHKVKEKPVEKEKKKEEPKMEEQPVYVPAPVPTHWCVPVTPILPGSGFPCFPQGGWPTAGFAFPGAWHPPGYGAHPMMPHHWPGGEGQEQEMQVSPGLPTEEYTDQTFPFLPHMESLDAFHGGGPGMTEGKVQAAEKGMPQPFAPAALPHMVQPGYYPGFPASFPGASDCGCGGSGGTAGVQAPYGGTFGQPPFFAGPYGQPMTQGSVSPSDGSQWQQTGAMPYPAGWGGPQAGGISGPPPFMPAGAPYGADPFGGYYGPEAIDPDDYMAKPWHPAHYPPREDEGEEN